MIIIFVCVGFDDYENMNAVHKKGILAPYFADKCQILNYIYVRRYVTFNSSLYNYWVDPLIKQNIRLKLKPSTVVWDRYKI